jgi:hypothetical protein
LQREILGTETYSMASRKRIDIKEGENFFGLVEFEGRDVSCMVALTVCETLHEGGERMTGDV